MEIVDDQNLLSDQGNNYNICWKEAFLFRIWNNSSSLQITERRLQELGMSSGQFFTTIDKETLDRTVKTILKVSCHMGTCE